MESPRERPRSHRRVGHPFARPQRARGEALAHQFYDRLESALSQQPYMAGDRFTVADISALCLIEFAGALVKLAPKPELTAIAAWHERVAARPSVQAEKA